MKEPFFDEVPENLIKNPKIASFKAETTELLNYATDGQLTEMQDLQVEIDGFNNSIDKLRKGKNQLYKELIELDEEEIKGGEFTQENFEIESRKNEKRKEIKVKDDMIKQLEEEIKIRNERKKSLTNSN